MEDKLWAVFAALITALGGWYVYDRDVSNKRITKLEDESNKNKTDIRVMEVRFTELKEDNEEIKRNLQDIIKLLTSRRK